MDYATSAHRCCSGCGEKVVTRFSPTDWKMTFDGEIISLHPSVGNWQLPCRSHYVIRAGRVIDAHLRVTSRSRPNSDATRALRRNIMAPSSLRMIARHRSLTSRTSQPAICGPICARGLGFEVRCERTVVDTVARQRGQIAFNKASQTHAVPAARIGIAASGISTAIWLTEAVPISETYAAEELSGGHTENLLSNSGRKVLS
ncbi:DUF6527 family protein [Mesorhizobium sp. M0976]|uniref:DUF6527 family protein n=1 Tax=Mesorhizobium sp. M0976 TaxID=2957038 RepID=UPI00333C1D9D